MKERILEDLIDELIQNKISDNDLLNLNKMMDVNPDIAKTVHESVETLTVLRQVSNQDLKRKLIEFDRNEQITSGSFRYGQLINIAIIITCLILSWMGLVNHFSNENIATRNLELIHTELMTHENYNPEDRMLLNSAYEFFKKGDYQNAARIYDAYSSNTDSQLKSEARWNVLMCHLAMEGPGERWKQNVKELMVILPTHLQLKGTNILKLVDSDFYRILIHDSSDRISILKPRLI